ncbi:MAG: hypothetical protein ABJC26_18660 [Gemmatimonadaceae bacterium]
MNKLIIPAVVAVLAGVGGGSGAAYVSAKKAAVVVAAHLADSVKAHVKDSTEKAGKAEIAAKVAADSAHAAATEGPLTPADSIRAAKNMPTTLSEATQGLPNAVDSKQPSAITKTDTKSATDAAHKSAGVGPPKTAEMQHAASTAVEPALPEKRIAKIFGAMQSKDAARVLEQMNDGDVRIILGMMPDKQAAAILSTFSPARAAAISRGEKSVKVDNKTDTKSESKGEVKGEKKTPGENS